MPVLEFGPPRSGEEIKLVYTPRDDPSSSTLTDVESVLHQHHQTDSWHDAIADVSEWKTGDVITIYPWLDHCAIPVGEVGRVIILQHSITSPAYSEILYRTPTTGFIGFHSTRNSSLGCYTTVLVPSAYQRPFSPIEQRWITAVKMYSSTLPHPLSSLYTSATPLLVAVVAQPRRGIQSALKRFVHSDIYDSNVWRIILGLAVAPRAMTQELVIEPIPYLTMPPQSMPRSMPNDYILNRCAHHRGITCGVYLDGHKLRLVIESFEKESIVRNVNVPCMIEGGVDLALNSNFIAILLVGPRWVLIYSIGGEFVTAFRLAERNTVIELHPTQPFVAVAMHPRVSIFDFEGQIYGCWARYYGSANAMAFDPVMEVLLLSYQYPDMIVAFPLSGGSEPVVVASGYVRPSYMPGRDRLISVLECRMVRLQFANTTDKHVDFSWVTRPIEKEVICISKRMKIVTGNKIAFIRQQDDEKTGEPKRKRQQSQNSD